MKRILTAAAVLALIAPLAQAATQDNADAKALRAECATKHAVKFDAPAAANEYRFVYSKGEYRGEAQGTKAVACGQAQFSEYLASADPVRVMNAYPTAAGRPKAAQQAIDKAASK